MLSERSAARRFDSLDSLRGICACVVALYHLHGTGVLLNLPVVRSGPLFVDFFFVLSGFVIAASYGAKLAGGFSVRDFLLLRVGRIWPLHMFVLLCWLAFELLIYFIGDSDATTRQAFSRDRTPALFVANIFLVQIFNAPQISWNQPAWSIAAELWTYVLFAILVSRVARFFVPLTAVIALACAISLGLHGGGWLLETVGVYVMARCIYGFGVGVLCYALLSRLTRTGTVSGTILEVAAVVAAVVYVGWAQAGPWTLAAPLVFGVVILTLASQEAKVSSLLTFKPLMLLGTLSFSIYLNHMLLEFRFLDVLRAAGKYVGRPLAENLIVEGAKTKVIVIPGVMGEILPLVCLGGIIFASWLTYRFIETPARLWSRDLVARRRKRREAAIKDAEAVAPTF